MQIVLENARRTSAARSNGIPPINTQRANTTRAGQRRPDDRDRRHLCEHRRTRATTGRRDSARFRCSDGCSDATSVSDDEHGAAHLHHAAHHQGDAGMTLMQQMTSMPCGIASSSRRQRVVRRRRAAGRSPMMLVIDSLRGRRAATPGQLRQSHVASDVITNVTTARRLHDGQRRARRVFSDAGQVMLHSVPKDIVTLSPTPTTNNAVTITQYPCGLHARRRAQHAGRQTCPTRSTGRSPARSRPARPAHARLSAGAERRERGVAARPALATAPTSSPPSPP